MGSLGNIKELEENYIKQSEAFTWGVETAVRVNGIVCEANGANVGFEIGMCDAPVAV